MIKRAFYSESIAGFLGRSTEAVLGTLTVNSSFGIEPTQRDAWIEEIRILRTALQPHRAEAGKVYLEFTVPRVGKRIDAVVVLRHAVFVMEFKVGESKFSGSAIDQVWDYALDLKNFHQTTHDKTVVPILIATHAANELIAIDTTEHGDAVLRPILVGADSLSQAMERALAFDTAPSAINAQQWETGRYSPTPTIVEAALALYGGHSVGDISRSDAGATNLAHTSEAISRIIRSARAESHKAVCFVTGVPGAGKTLVGLNIATQHFDKNSELYSVFLSGNGPLVAILREALARDKVRREREQSRDLKLGQARSEVKAFLQNVHHFRDDCIADPGPPIEHVALFDEAQRAWNLEQTAGFMLRKKKRPNFDKSEPEFLLSCMDRHHDWAVVVCLVGGGQEINTGEAGIGEWIDSVLRSFAGWHVHISSRLRDTEYGAGKVLEALRPRPNVHVDDGLHLGVSMRSFRAENVSAFVKALLDHEKDEARRLHEEIAGRYPIVLTRDLDKARGWLRAKARGSERYGLVVSSQAQRLKPHAIDVRAPMNPIHWFLGPKDDVRSSYYLEDAATEFDVQGLELDWAAVVWDGDFRWNEGRWGHFGFKGKKWQRVKQLERQSYLKNAYRVLLTRARQGMVIVVPEGASNDPTRAAEFYDPTFAYLKAVGLQVL